jgi:uncharacterized protein
MEFMVVAYDGTDSAARERRANARAAHLRGVDQMRTEGSFIEGGAILGENDEMIGSTLYLRFQSRAALDEWLKSDPYMTGGVWRDVQVLPIRLVSVRATAS